MNDAKSISAKSRAGKARAAALTPQQRRAISQKGGQKRWGTLPKATHKGNLKEDFGIDVDCYVLNDELKTAVISQTGMGRAIALSSARGTDFLKFVSGQNIREFIGGELARKIENPIRFRTDNPGGELLCPEAHGYDVTILIDVCQAILRAEESNRLGVRQQRMIKQAQAIISACAKSGIQNLVYKIAGYDSTKAEVINAFRMFVQEEAREYEKEFPDELYSEWYRLYQVEKPKRGASWKFRWLTIDHVYVPLAKSQGKILDLARDAKSNSETPNACLHQFLSDVGKKALGRHLGKLTGIANLSSTREEYEKNVEKVFGIPAVDRQLSIPGM